ncbi:hypothetical protein Tco_0944987 [Tanacetum coccineum]
MYSRFIKTNDFKGVPHPLSGDYTPKPQEEIDESLYVYGSIRTSSKHFVDPKSESSRVPPEVYVSTPITTNEKGVSAPKSKEVEPSCVSHIKTPRQLIKDQETPKVNRKNWNAMMERELREGYSFTKKKCFFCGNLSHLIKDCDYYEKKIAREAEFKKQRVFNTVQLNAGRPNINSVRPNINTGRTNVNHDHPLKNIEDREEGSDEMVRSIMKDKSEDFETPTQGKTLGEAYISPEGLEAAETLAKDELELSKTQKNRMAQVQEAAKYYTEEDWDSVRAKLEANRDLSSKVSSIYFSSDAFAKKMVELINEKKRMYKEQRER